MPLSDARKPFGKPEKILGRNYGSLLHSNSPHASLQAPYGRQQSQVPSTAFPSAALTSIMTRANEVRKNYSSAEKERGASRPALALTQPPLASPQSDEGCELLRWYEVRRTRSEPDRQLRSCSPAGSFDPGTGEKRRATSGEEEDDEVFEVGRSANVQWRERELSLLLEEYCTGINKK